MEINLPGVMTIRNNMASVKFSRKEFEKSIKLTKEVEEKISMMGTHLESLNEEEIELEILPNRPDLFSMQGFMRAFSGFIGKKNKQNYTIKKSDAQIIVDPIVNKIRPYSMAAIVKKVKFTDEKIKEIMQWQEKIHSTIGRKRKKVALGYYVLEKVKFPIRYTAKSPKEIVFEPLEMPEKMDALQILSRHPTGREYANQLEGLDKFPVYYDDNKEVLSMPPIINSNNSGKILPGTSNVLVECSGTDINILKKVISMAVCDLIDCGGEAYSIEVIYGSKKEAVNLQPEKVKLNIENVNRLLGTNLKESEIKSCLEKMGHQYSGGIVSVPCYRTDILHEVDLIEDIAIAYGYEKFVPEIPPISTIASESSREKFKRKLAEILTGLRFVECSSLHLLTGEDIKKHNLKAQNLIEVEDSKTDYKFLRPDVLSSSLRVFSTNVDSEYPQRIFEIGEVFEFDGSKETGVKESDNLAISLAPGNFTELKQILEYLGKMLELNFTIKETEDSRFIDGRVGEIILDNKQIGVIGEIHPQLLKNWKIKMPVVSLELGIDKLM